jgi:hypothetical protein
MSQVSMLPQAAVLRIVIGALALFACLAVGRPAALADNCEACHVGSLLGKPYSQEKARAVSKAVEIREMTVGRTAVTADYRSDRLNIVVDLKGNVRRADCG